MDVIHRDLLELADYAYGRLRTRLDGLTDEEYVWEPADGCWSVRAVGDGTYRMDGSGAPTEPAPLTTIAWRICHLIDMLAADRNAAWLGVTPDATVDRPGEPGQAGPATEELDRAYARFRGHLAAVEVETLTAPMGRVAGPYARSSRASFVLHELDELIHHAAEIATLRDLYRALNPQ